MISVYCNTLEKTLDACLPSQYLDDNGKCYDCAINCLKCESENRCSECSDSYFLDKESELNKDSESLCSPCPENCYYCLDGENCILCDIGYYLKDSVCTCLYPNGCPHWSFYEGRILHDGPCDHGFYYLDGECFQCLEGCKRCYSITRCKKCYNDYDYVSGLCYKSDNSSISWGYLIQASFINLLGLLIS